MIPRKQLNKLKHLFAEDGIALTDAEALDVGLWLIARVRPVIKSVPLDKMALFATMRGEIETIRKIMPLANLYEWRQKNLNK